jgi:C-terminal processing protease CtpA/Prc
LFRRSLFVLTTTTALLAGGAHLLAAPLPAEIDLLREKARDCEAKGQWSEACRLYDELVKKDRNLADRDGYQRCLRHVLQARRHRDATFRQILLSLKPAQAAEVYEDVLVKLRNNYVDREKAEINELFQQGLEEFGFALQDDFFIREHLPQVRRPAIEAFRARLAEWRDRKLQTTREARDQVLAVALASRRSLGLDSSLVFLEFACGACNGLDEHTTYLTPGHLNEIQASLKGDTVVVRSVEFQLLLDEGTRIGVVRVLTFHENTVQELRDALVQLQTMGMDVLILDLRGNPGGLFRPAVQVAEIFLQEGVIVLTQSRLRGYNRTYKAENPNAVDIPLVVLVDGETASSAEVVAGALKENQRATLVGQNTFGKGSIQAVLALEKVPAGIRITVAKFFSPANYPYSGKGVAPHDVVDAGPEAQLIAARQVARRLAMMMPR